MQKLRPDLAIGANLQRIRMENKMTQSVVALKLQLSGLDISDESYRKIEENKRCIRISELVALKLLFKVDFNDFFKGLIP